MILDDILIEQGLELIQEIKEHMKKMPVEEWGAYRQRNREKFDDLVMQVGAFEASILNEPVVPMELAILIGTFVDEEYSTLIEPLIWLFAVSTDSYCKDLHLESHSKLIETEKVRVRGLDYEQLVQHHKNLFRRRMSNTRALAILEVL